MTDETMNALKLLHPEGQENPFQLGHWNGSSKEVHGDAVLLDAMVQALDLQAAPGVDGWTPQRLKWMFGNQGDGDVECTAFRNFLTILFRSMAVGTAPGRQMLTASRLTPLEKPNGGIRPVACGSIFYRLGIKYCLNSGTVD